MRFFNSVVVGALALGGCSYYVVNLPVADAESQIQPVKDIRRGVPPQLGTIIARTLARDPAERFGTPAELAAVVRSAEGPGPGFRVDFQTALSGVEEAYWEGWEMGYPAERLREVIFSRKWPLDRVRRPKSR